MKRTSVSVCLIILLVMHATMLARAEASDVLTWAETLTDQIIAEFELPNHLYAVSVTDINGTYVPSSNVNVWPSNLMLRVLTAATKHNPDKYLPQLLENLEALKKNYLLFREGEWRFNPSRGGWNNYYDDNGGMLLALIESYLVTEDSSLLQLAHDTYAYMLTGEDGVQGGGLYQNEAKKEKKVTSATVQAVIGALMLYQITGDPAYTSHAHRLYGWLTSTLQDSRDGLFWSNVDARSGEVKRVKMARNSAYPSIANLLFYQVYGDAAYLAEAERIAQAAADKWMATEDMSRWTLFGRPGRSAFKLIDAWIDLYESTGEERWLALSRTAITEVYLRGRDPRGHFGYEWGLPRPEALKTWELLDQAAVARALWRVAEHVSG